MNPGRPDPAEYNPYFGTYIGKTLDVTDPVEALDRQLREVLTLLMPLSEAQQLRAYAEGKWTLRELLGHITDAERIFAYRALRVARNDKTPLSSFDEKPYVEAAEANRCDWRRMLEEFEHVRRSSILMLRNMPEAAWTRMGTSSGSPISVRAMVFIMLGHVTHHMQIVRERYLI